LACFILYQTVKNSMRHTKIDDDGDKEWIMQLR
jgi:hypothetical protein